MVFTMGEKILYLVPTQSFFFLLFDTPDQVGLLEWFYMLSEKIIFFILLGNPYLRNLIMKEKDP